MPRGVFRFLITTILNFFIFYKRVQFLAEIFPRFFRLFL